MNVENNNSLLVEEFFIMTREKERELRLFRIISLTVAFSLVVISILLLVLERPRGESIQNLLLVLTATALFSGAVTALVFSSLSSRESEQQIGLTLERVLRDVFLPLRNTIEDNAINGYRWTTHLIRPSKADPLADYAIQLIRFGYTRKKLPEEVFIVCMASMDDEALDPYEDPNRYLMRWQIDHNLDPSDKQVFFPAMLKVDDLVIEPTIRDITVRGVRTCQYRYRIPRDIRSRERNRIDLSAITRKYLLDSQINVKAILFTTVMDAEFSCTVDSSIECKRLSVGANVTGLGPRGEVSSGPTYAAPHSTVAAYVRYNYPLQAGTAITFYIDRDRP
jgi:hypothetical protein